MNDFPDNFVTEEELVASGAHHHPFPGGADGAEGAQLHDQVGITSLVLGPGVLVQVVQEAELQKRADRANQSVLFFLAGANF